MITSNGKHSLKRRVEHISIENEDGTSTVEYQIREMSAGARDAFYDRFNSRTKFVDGKPAGPAKVQGLQADLLSNCLFKQDGKPVTKEEVEDWPASTVDWIFQKASKINQVETQDAGAAEPKKE